MKYLFRGKRVDNGEWVYGQLLQSAPEDVQCYIIPIFIYNAYEHEVIGQWKLSNDVYNEVETDTVGQWTGLEDVNGIKIFEGDILSEENNRHDGETVYLKYEVRFINGCYYSVDMEDDESNTTCLTAQNFLISEVIGNIYEGE